MTHSINTEIWGESGLFIDGVSIPDSGSFQQYDILQSGPGKRVSDPMCPGIVFKNNKPLLGFSSIGTGLFEETVDNLFNVLYLDKTVMIL